MGAFEFEKELHRPKGSSEEENELTRLRAEVSRLQFQIDKTEAAHAVVLGMYEKQIRELSQRAGIAERKKMGA